jgi:hypothetical protein
MHVILTADLRVRPGDATVSRASPDERRTEDSLHRLARLPQFGSRDNRGSECVPQFITGSEIHVFMAYKWRQTEPLVNGKPKGPQLVSSVVTTKPLQGNDSDCPAAFKNHGVLRVFDGRQTTGITLPDDYVRADERLSREERRPVSSESTDPFPGSAAAFDCAALPALAAAWTSRQAQ